MIKFTLVALLSIVLQSTAPTPVSAPTGKPIAVCEVLHNLASYRGKMLEIRGSWYGDLLQAPVCAPLNISGHKWHTSVQLKFPDKGIRYADGKIPDWDFSYTTYIRLFEQAELQRQSQHTLVMATFTGRIDAPADYILPDGRVMGAGTQGQFPAVLVMKDIKDIVVVKIN